MIPFVQTYHTCLGSFNKYIRQNFSQLLQEVLAFQRYRLLAAYRRNKNLQDLLVHATLENPKQSEQPSCFYISYVYNQISVKGGLISQRIEFYTENVVYAIQCQSCGMLYSILVKQSTLFARGLSGSLVE